MDDDDVIPVDPDVEASSATRPHREVDILTVIALGGMVGASARYAMVRWLPITGDAFPWATFWTNLVGSFVLGVVLVVAVERFAGSRYLRPFAATGVIGAFTTMSTYAVEIALRFKDGHASVAFVYAIASLAGGLVCATAGIRAGRAVARGAVAA